MKKHTKPMRLKTPLLTTLLLAIFPLTSLAAGPVAPNAGSILQQVQPVVPHKPSSNETGLSIEQADGSKLPPSAPFLVKRIQITGNTQIDTPTLFALVADAQGKTLTLSQLGEVAARISKYYQDKGYTVSRAIIPAQVIRDGLVVIEVIEARYGKISLANTSQVNDALLQASLSPLQSGQPIVQSEMDRSLLLLSDVAGVVLGASLRPGEVVGTSDLVVDTTPGPATSGNVTLDDYGSRYTGRARIGGAFILNNPLHHGDTLSVNGLSSGTHMNYGHLAYESLLSGQGLRVGGAFSGLNYSLGEPLSALDAHGSAQVGSLWVKQPLMRSRVNNLYGQIQFDGLQLKDRIDASATVTDRRLKNWTLSMTADTRDTILSGGINTWSLGLTRGRIEFDNPAARLADAATGKTEGYYSKGNASLSRLQSLSSASALYLAVSGQWAGTNLDSSQKMSAGGYDSVRAYDMGAISGDRGYLFSAEYRHDMGQVWMGQTTAVAFIDNARVTVNAKPWSNAVNSATLNGFGLGLTWIRPGQWSVKAYVAKPMGDIPVLVGSTNSARGWLEISKQF